jgi:hypothetical protein
MRTLDPDFDLLIGLLWIYFKDLWREDITNLPIIDKRQKLLKLRNCRSKVFFLFNENSVQKIFFQILMRKLRQKI